VIKSKERRKKKCGLHLIKAKNASNVNPGSATEAYLWIEKKTSITSLKHILRVRTSQVGIIRVEKERPSSY